MGAANSIPEAPPAGSSTPSGATLGRRPENIRGLRLPPTTPALSGALVPTGTQGGRRLQEVLAAHLSAVGGVAGGLSAGAAIAELETMGTVRNAVHLKPEDLRLVPVAEMMGGEGAAAAASAAGDTGADCRGTAAPSPSGRHSLEFSFDAIVRGAVTVFCHAREVEPPAAAADAAGGGGGVTAHFTGTSPTGGAPFRTRFDAGLKQWYRQRPETSLDLTSGDWVVRSGGGGPVWPLIICMESGWDEAEVEAEAGGGGEIAGAEAASITGGVRAGVGGGRDKLVEGEVTYVTLVRPNRSGGPWGLRVVKQKVLFEGVLYDIQTIYGMGTPGVSSATGRGDGGQDDESAAAAAAATVPAAVAAAAAGGGGCGGGGADGGGGGDAASAASAAEESDVDAERPAVEEVDAPGGECVVCLSDKREVFVLPCRHLCLCVDCAPDYKRQANRCPICRKSIEQLVRLRPQRPQTNAAT